ncbi:hypothetical protein EGW08_011043 [Elysia chlorotica]|uniref:Galaxin-like repeats domain-containing protein n=1 Tax=Elysia chlorotica TaxID=188477 RepID=A0A433THW2_ELYCH|nr:hypothetical protein EGW08_011043 [Elysia chlorotica]
MNSTILILLFSICFGIFFDGCWGFRDWCITNDGPKQIDTETETCCNNMVYSLLVNQECCGDSIINLNESICCKGQAWPRFVNSPTDGKRWEQSCCGSHVIFGDLRACCFGGPVTLTQEQIQARDYLQCCSAGVVADVRVEECCGGKVLRRHQHTKCCAGEEIDSRSNWCANKLGQQVKLALGQNVCLDSVYTVTEESCCDGVINHTVPQVDPHDTRRVNPHFGCCQSTVIDPTREKCCLPEEPQYKSHPIPKEPTFECCGNGHFNKSYQACLSGQVVNKGPGQTQCGSSLINLQHQGCCATHLPYYKASEKCCNGRVSSVIPINQRCCNGAGVGENQVCCDGVKPVTRTHSQDDACCYNERTSEGRTFNTMNQKCYEGRVVTVAPHMEVCGNEEYNPKTEICCRDAGGLKYKKYSLQTGYTHCCGLSPHNESQSCCYGRLFDIPTHEASCCYRDYKAYTYHDPQSKCTSQCPGSGSHYDIREETCCDGVVHPYRRRYSCCGPFYYKDKIRGRKTKQRWPFACCNKKNIFSNKTSTCQNGEIQTKFQGIIDTQAVCDRRFWKSVDGVVDRACTSNYALEGKIRSVRILRKAIPDVAYVEMTLNRIQVANIRSGGGDWKGPHKLKFQVHIPMAPSVRCSPRGMSRRRGKVAVFFDAPVRGGKVTIQSQDKFRIVYYNKVFRKLRRYGMTESFCEQSNLYSTLIRQQKHIRS